MKKKFEKPLLKQFRDMTNEDFSLYPVWVQCHIIDHNEDWIDETDEETFRPWIGKLPVDPNEAMYLVKTNFILADGTECKGFITPQEQNTEINLGIQHPNIITDNGELVCFWYGALPQNYIDNMIKAVYIKLGKKPEEIFPISYSAVSGLSNGITKGNIKGFTVENNRIYNPVL